MRQLAPQRRQRTPAQSPTCLLAVIKGADLALDVADAIKKELAAQSLQAKKFACQKARKPCYTPVSESEYTFSLDSFGYTGVG